MDLLLADEVFMCYSACMLYFGSDLEYLTGSYVLFIWQEVEVCLRMCISKVLGVKGSGFSVYCFVIII